MLQTACTCWIDAAIDLLDRAHNAVKTPHILHYVVTETPNPHLIRFSPVRVRPSDLAVSTHLLLSQDQHPLWLDGMVRRQVLPAAPRHTVLEGLPYPVPGGPRDAQVMPLPVIDEERQLCHLRQRLFVGKVSHSRFSSCQLPPWSYFIPLHKHPVMLTTAFISRFLDLQASV